MKLKRKDQYLQYVLHLNLDADEAMRDLDKMSNMVKELKRSKSALKDLIKKANRLKELLTEVKSLTDSLKS